MKTKIFLLLSIAFLTCGGCKKPSDLVQNSLLKGKLVVSENCGYYVVQVISSTDLQLTQNWFDQKRNTNFTNVFTVENWCTWTSKKINEGDEFYFQLKDNQSSEFKPCAMLRCNLFYPTPPARHIITVK